jgi:hypothetical protein
MRFLVDSVAMPLRARYTFALAPVVREAHLQFLILKTRLKNASLILILKSRLKNANDLYE